MYKTLRPIKDAYITNRVINGTVQTGSNVGTAGSIDVYKLYGFTATTTGSVDVPNVELTRALIKFDMSPLSALVSAGKVDINNSTFRCTLVLHDVYGGQPTPRNFSIDVFPLSASFEEGLGKDVVFYSDYDECNWASASAGQAWIGTGCSFAGNETVSCDYLTGALGTSLTSQQLFVTGEEDLTVDVTAAVSSSLVGTIPDEGFRLSLTSAIETDLHTYFVKRFASRTAFNDDLRPELVVRFDDSVQDDTAAMYLDAPGQMFLRNYVNSVPASILSGTVAVTGDDCVILTLTTPVSGGSYVTYFTGSQHRSGANPQPGLYSASVVVSSVTPELVAQWQRSGSVTFDPTWSSIDGTVTYHVGAPVVFQMPQRGPVAIDPRRLDVVVHGLRARLAADEATVLRVNVFDRTSPHVLRATRVPVERPGTVLRDVHYQVRDAVTGRVKIPFDLTLNSTRVSSDSKGMYFKLDAANLTSGRSYVVDVKVVTGDDVQLHEACSPQFRVADAA